MLEVRATGVHRIAEVFQRHLRMFGDIALVTSAHLPPRCLATAGRGEQLPGIAPARSARPRCSVADQHMGVGSGHAERTHAGQPLALVTRPGSRLAHHPQRHASPFDAWVGSVEVDLSGQLVVLQREQDLRQSRSAGHWLEVADVGLYRSHQQRPVSRALRAEHGIQRAQFDRVAQRSAGTMCLDVVDLARLGSGIAQGSGDHRLLGVDVRNRDSAAGAVVVERATLDHPEHRIPVTLGVGQALENQHHAALSPAIAVGGGVEGLATPIAGDRPQLADQDETIGRKDQVHPAGQRQVAFTAAQALAGLVQRHQRRRAGGVDHHRRALPAQGVGDTSGDKAGLAVELVRIDVSHLAELLAQPYIVVGTGPHEHAQLAAIEGKRVDSRMLQRFPGNFERDSLLRVHALGLARRDTEEGRVEALHAFDEAAAHHVGLSRDIRVGIVVIGGVASLGGHVAGRVGSVLQQAPQPPGAIRATRQAATQADHRDRSGPAVRPSRQLLLQAADSADGLGETGLQLLLAHI